MFVSSSITSLENLESWFRTSNRHGYWSIYRGNDKKPGERTASLVYESPETGWNALRDALFIQTNSGGGLFTVYVANSEKDTSGFTTRFAAPITIGGQQQVAQLNGVPQESIGAIVEKTVNDRIAAYESQREIEDLKNEIASIKKEKNSKGIAGIFSQFGDLLEESPALANIVTPIIHGLTAKFLGTENQIPSMAGVPGEITHQFSKENDSEEFSEAYTEDEMNRLANCINELSKHFTDPIALLEKFTEFVNKNPEGAKLMLSSIIK